MDNVPTSSMCQPQVLLASSILSATNAPEMGGLEDLIHQRQVTLFNAFDQLSRLGDSNIEPPQLAVVGDQSTGKSSVLEAIV